MPVVIPPPASVQCTSAMNLVGQSVVELPLQEDAQTVMHAAYSSTESSMPMRDSVLMVVPSIITAESTMDPSLITAVVTDDTTVLTANDVIVSLSPYPKSSQIRQRKRKCETADVLTSSPYKTRVLERSLKSTTKTKQPNIANLLNTSHGANGKQAKKMTCRKDKPRGRRRNVGDKNKETKKQQDTSH